MSDKTSKVDFEIAFTAFLASVVNVFPHHSRVYYLIQLSGFGLLVSTIFRRMTVSESRTQGTLFIISSQSLILFSTICWGYLIFILAIEITSQVGSIPRELLFSVLVISFFTAALTLQELILGGTMATAQRVLENVREKHHGEFLDVVFRRLIKKVEPLRTDLDGISYQMRLDEKPEEKLLASTESSGLIILQAIGAILGVGAFVSIYYIVSLLWGLLFNTPTYYAFLIGFSLALLSAWFELLYAQFGIFSVLKGATPGLTITIATSTLIFGQLFVS